MNARVTREEIERIKAHAEPRAMIFTHQVSKDAATHGEIYGARETPERRFGRALIAGNLASAPEETAGSARLGAVEFEDRVDLVLERVAQLARLLHRGCTRR